MISIDKLVQQLQQCKDTSIKLPSTNESIFIQKTAVEIRKYELEMLNNNFKQLNEANYTMDSELIQQSIVPNASSNTAFSNTDKKDYIQETIPSKSLIIYMENETANIPEILLKLLPYYFKENEWYIYGVKNPESFYKSFLLLYKVDFIIKNKTEKKNDVATFKREMAMQYENFYKVLNYRKLHFPRNEMVHNLTSVDNYTEFDMFQFIADYSKINFIILDIITEKYIDVLYTDNTLNTSFSSNIKNNEYVIIIKYAASTYLPLMNSNGIHGFNATSIISIISKNFERMVFNKYKEPRYCIDYNKTETPLETPLDTIGSICEDYSFMTRMIDINKLIDVTNITMPVEDMIDIIEQEDEPLGNTITTIDTKTFIKVIKNNRITDSSLPKQEAIIQKVNDLELILLKVPMASDNKPKKTKQAIAIEAKEAKIELVKNSKIVNKNNKPITNNIDTNLEDESLKIISKYNLLDLQRMAKLHKIDTQKMGTCGKKINKLKAELYEDIQKKM